MIRLPVAAFGALVVATVAAFFVTQHLKVSTPLIAGAPAPVPSVINPVSGVTCGPPGRPVNHRQTYITFYLQHRADSVAVYIVDPSGTIVRTLSTGFRMGIVRRNPPGQFLWNGRDDNGRIAPDGTYYYRIALLGQGRTIELTAKPITVRTVPPQPVVTGVSPSLISPPGTPVTAQLKGARGFTGVVRIYRTDLPGKPQVVTSYPSRRPATASWNGLIKQRPAPAGTYLFGLDDTDKACNVGHFPPTNPPAPGSTAHAGVTVRYLAAQPPLAAVPAGTEATVFIDSRRRPYRWALRAVGRKPVLAHGRGAGVALRVRVPSATGPGIYELAIRSGSNRTLVPLIAGAPRNTRRARVLVVLPALTWQGENPVDDDGDGIPNTLNAGGPIALTRPLAGGLPAGLSDEAALLAYLNKAHLHYDLATDLELAGGGEAALAGRRGVVLAGSERWLPSPLSAALRNFVLGGGHVLSAGIGSLQRTVTISGQHALDPTPAAPTDAFGARPGAVVSGNRDLLTVIGDALHIFSGTSGAFADVRTFQSIKPAGSETVSAAGTSSQTPSIIGFGLGRGAVVEAGVPDFGSQVARRVDFQELLTRVWALLNK